MDAFEQVVSEILWMDGYWVRTSVKVDLTKEEKVSIGRPSSPRWELDIVGYSGRDNTLRVVDCKATWIRAESRSRPLTAAMRSPPSVTSSSAMTAFN
jgi:hypothetical protein